MARKKEKSQNQSSVPFTLDDIKDIGGEQTDIQLLEFLSDTEEAIDQAPDDDFDSSITKQELANFIKTLGISKHRNNIISDEESSEDEGGSTGEEDDVDDDEGEDKDLTNKQQNSSKTSKVQASQTQSNKKKRFDSSDEESDEDNDDDDHGQLKHKVQDGEVSSTSSSGAVLDVTDIKRSILQPRNYLLFKADGKWFENLFAKDPPNAAAPTKTELDELRSIAKILYENEVAIYKSRQDRKKSSDAEWVRTVLKSGTTSDKIAALTLQVQESPVHNMSSLEVLLSLTKKKSREEALLALDAAQDLFTSELLPENRKLKLFEQHPHSLIVELSSGNKESRDKRLLAWYYEELLKTAYSSFVANLEILAHDQVEAMKKKAIFTIFSLLQSRPEQEKRLLKQLVNKIGDPNKKMAARTAHLLARLVQAHPNMKSVVVSEVESLLHRSNISPRAQYYAMCFMSQLLLTANDSQLAAKLINIYFSLFQVLVKKKTQDSKMLSALLTGVNRAFPFAKENQKKIEEQMDALYKMVHKTNFNTSIQALMLLHQVCDSNDSVSDRFYMALYDKLRDQELAHSSKQTLFLNLLFKSMKSDISDKRVQAFIKRILQVSCQQSPQFIAGALILISEVLRAKPGLLVLQKNELSRSNVMDDTDSDEEEHFVDVKEDDDDDAEKENGAEQKNPVKDDGASSKQKSGWIHKDSVEAYNALHRNPHYCNAQRECVWELGKLAYHYHPSVTLFANNLLKGESLTFDGDPLANFTLLRFLDRFVFRNPKSKEKLSDEAKSSKLLSRRKVQTAKGSRSLDVTSDEYRQQNESKVPEDELYLYRYLTNTKRKSKQKLDEEDSDAGSIDDDEFDRLLDQQEFGITAEENEFDFAGMVKPSGEQSSSDEDDDDDDVSLDSDMDLSDEEPEEFDEDFGAISMSEDDEEGEEEGGTAGFNEEEVAFSDEETFEPKPKKGVKRKSSSFKQREVDLFAAADEFAHLIEENKDTEMDTITSEAIISKDKSSSKQIKWEMKKGNKTDWKKMKSKPRKPKGKLTRRK